MHAGDIITYLEYQFEIDLFGSYKFSDDKTFYSRVGDQIEPNVI